MEAAIYCPGPSLDWALAQPRRDSRLTIAVNRAAERVVADYWAMLDPVTWEITGRLASSPAVVCAPSCWRELVARQPEAEALGWAFPDAKLAESLAPLARWRTKSMTVAMVLAATLGAKRIDLWGVDLEGEADFDGRSYGCQRRDPARWTAERSLLNQVARNLADHAVPVRRITPGGIEDWVESSC